MLKRLPQDQLEDESVNAVSSFLNANKWEFNRQIRDKSGIDGEIEIVRGIERTGRFLKCQIKAGTSYITSETETSLRIRVERRYLEHWGQMSAQVVLFFYHPDTRNIFWKAIKPYLALNPALLISAGETCVISFDKEQEQLERDCLPLLEALDAGRFSYGDILIEPSRLELGWSNWFPVKDFSTLWQADANVGRRSLVMPHLSGEFAFVIQSDQMLKSVDCELREFVRIESIEPVPHDHIPEQVFVELLNQTLLILAKAKNLRRHGERFYFSPEVLKTVETNQFSYLSLKGRQESRTKIYIQKIGTRTEYKHHAVRLSFIRHMIEWYLQIDPDWQFTYPFGRSPSRTEVGARLTSEKANTHNKDYLYLLHFWRKFLSTSDEMIAIPCSDSSDVRTINVSSLPLQFKFHFRLFRDYVGPKIAG